MKVKTSISSLLSVRNQHGEFEVIVVDGGSTDDTVDKARDHALVVTSERGRAVQMNAGARTASGEVLLFLHADSVLDPMALLHLRQSMTDTRL